MYHSQCPTLNLFITKGNVCTIIVDVTMHNKAHRSLLGTFLMLLESFDIRGLPDVARECARIVQRLFGGLGSRYFQSIVLLVAIILEGYNVDLHKVGFAC